MMGEAVGLTSGSPSSRRTAPRKPSGASAAAATSPAPGLASLPLATPPPTGVTTSAASSSGAWRVAAGEGPPLAVPEEAERTGARPRPRRRRRSADAMRSSLRPSMLTIRLAVGSGGAVRGGWGAAAAAAAGSGQHPAAAAAGFHWRFPCTRIHPTAPLTLPRSLNLRLHRLPHQFGAHRRLRLLHPRRDAAAQQRACGGGAGGAGRAHEVNRWGGGLHCKLATWAGTHHHPPAPASASAPSQLGSGVCGSGSAPAAAAAAARLRRRASVRASLPRRW